MGRCALFICAALSLSAVPAGAGVPAAPSDHFDGERFFNPGERFDKSFFDLLKFYFTRTPGEWTRGMDIPAGPPPPPPASVPRSHLRITYVNHSTALIQADGLNLLTDPIWSPRASPLSWAGPRRFRPPGIRFEDLPRIHAVLISHNHYDHLDLPTLERLRQAHDPWFVAGLNNGALLREAGIGKIVELDWREAWTLPNGCKLWGAASRHWSGRVAGGRNKSLWLSYVIETTGGPVYFAGDTGYGEHFLQTQRDHGAMRAALLPIGAYLPRWLTDYQHMDPAQAVQAHADLGAAVSFGIHWGTFEVADDGQFQPPADLTAAAAARGLPPGVFQAAEFGAGYDVQLLENARSCTH